MIENTRVQSARYRVRLAVLQVDLYPEEPVYQTALAARRNELCVLWEAVYRVEAPGWILAGLPQPKGEV